MASKYEKRTGKTAGRFNLYDIMTMNGWTNEDEQRRELRKLKKRVKARLARLEQSQYAVYGKKVLQETPFADVLRNPDAFTMQEQLAAFARLSQAQISITGIKERLSLQEEWAGNAASHYLDKYGLIGYSEFMGAAKYGGLLDVYGSEETARLAEMAEKGKINALQVLSNFRRYASFG